MNHLIHIDDIKQFANKEKELETLILAVKINNKDIGMEFGIEKLCYANDEKRKTTAGGRNRTTKSRKNRNTWKKGNIQVLGNIGSGYY